VERGEGEDRPRAGGLAEVVELPASFKLMNSLPQTSMSRIESWILVVMQ
jgi:hypothetical protein